MSLWNWIRSCFTTNGFDKQVHETEVRQLNDDTLSNWDKSQECLDDICNKFREVEEGFVNDPPRIE